jgi:haloalkane dehalogenase
LQSRKISQAYYEIRVEGALGKFWEEWFDGLSVCQGIRGDDDLPITVLCGWLPDQPALYGIIAKIRDLNLTLLSISKTEGEFQDESQ